MSLPPPVQRRARDRCNAIRHRIARLSHAANSAHYGSSLSCVEILDAILSAAHLPAAAPAERDRIVLSKGHAAMAFYAALATHGQLDPALLETYLTDGSALWGHVTRTARAPGIDASTGSLGHGLGLSAGFALADRLQRRRRRVFCVLSDGELNEGSTWEAALFAGHHALSGIVAVLDYNKLQGLDFAADVMAPEPLAAKWHSFGWETTELNGHDSEALAAALARPAADRPRIAIAHTVKGKGVARIEHTVASHYHAARGADADVFAGALAADA